MINVAMLLGRVGKKNNKQMKNGSEMTTLSIATNRKYKDSSGAYQDHTTWHLVNCFSKLAEIANKYVHVGDLVFVQGEIQNKLIESGERAGHYTYSLHASDIKFIPKSDKSNSESKLNQENIAHKQGAIFQDDDIPF